MADRAEPRLLLTHSARSWVQDLHFHLIDHGGALVHGYALSAEEAVTASVDVLVDDDVCSFLSKRLVSDLRHRGVSVIGVFDPEDGEAGTGRLAEVGIDVHLPSDAPMETFVAGVVPAGRPIGAAGRSPRPERRQGASLAHPVVAVAAAGGGAGATEIALAMARRMGGKGRQVVLADADEVTPSIAQRLRLPLYPNIRTAADAICRDGDGIEDSLIEVAARTRVLVGLPNARLWHELRPTEVASVVADAATLATVVVNVGSSIEDVPTLGGPARFGIARSMIEAADAIVLVATSSPVGSSTGWRVPTSSSATRTCTPFSIASRGADTASAESARSWTGSPHPTHHAGADRWQCRPGGMEGRGSRRWPLSPRRRPVDPSRRAHRRGPMTAGTYAAMRSRLLSRLEEFDGDTIGGAALDEVVDGYEAEAGAGIPDAPPLRDVGEMKRRLVDSVAGFGPLQTVFDDPGTEEIFLEGDRVTFLDGEGRLRPAPIPATEAEVLHIVKRLLALTDRHVDASNPIVQARVLDGTARLTAVMPPVSDRLSATGEALLPEAGVVAAPRGTEIADTGGRRVPARHHAGAVLGARLGPARCRKDVAAGGAAPCCARHPLCRGGSGAPRAAQSDELFLRGEAPRPGWLRRDTASGAGEAGARDAPRSHRGRRGPWR